VCGKTCWRKKRWVGILALSRPTRRRGRPQRSVVYPASTDRRGGRRRILLSIVYMRGGWSGTSYLLPRGVFSSIEAGLKFYGACLKMLRRPTPGMTIGRLHEALIAINSLQERFQIRDERRPSSNKTLLITISRSKALQPGDERGWQQVLTWASKGQVVNPNLKRLRGGRFCCAYLDDKPETSQEVLQKKTDPSVSAHARRVRDQDIRDFRTGGACSSIKMWSVNLLPRRGANLPRREEETLSGAKKKNLKNAFASPFSCQMSCYEFVHRGEMEEPHLLSLLFSGRTARFLRLSTTPYRNEDQSLLRAWESRLPSQGETTG